MSMLVKTQLRPSPSPPSARESRGLNSLGPALGVSFCDALIFQVSALIPNKITVAGLLFPHQFRSFIKKTPNFKFPFLFCHKIGTFL